MTRTTSLVAAIAATLLVIPSLSYAKTVKACEEEWKANKAAIQASGKKKTEFMAACRAEAATAAPTTQAPARQPTPQPAPKQTTAEPPKPTPAPTQPAPRTTATPTKAGQYASESEAKSHCYGGDIVVWVNTKSGIYHFAGHRSYGNTRAGAYMCEKEATAAGMRASKTEKRPTATQ